MFSNICLFLLFFLKIFMKYSRKTFVYIYILEKEMTAHSSILAWRILWMEEPDGLLSIGSQRVGHDCSDLACMYALEKEMVTHCSILAWRIPGREEPGKLPSTGSHRVRHNWSDVTAKAAAWRLLGEFLDINVPWNPEILWCFQFVELSLLPLAFSPSLTVASRLLHPYSTEDKTSRLIIKQSSTARSTQGESQS